MPFHSFNVVFSTDGGRVPIITPSVFTFGNNNVFDEVLTAPLTDHPITATIAHATLKSWMIVANETMTVKTNSTSVPHNTWDLVPGKPVFWNTDLVGMTNPIDADITVFYVTIAGSAVGELVMQFLQDL